MKKIVAGENGSPSRIRRMLLGAAAIAALVPAMFGGVAGAQAQDYPTKPIRIIVPFGPGGLADITMRLAGEKLSGILGQQFVVAFARAVSPFMKPGADTVMHTPGIFVRNPATDAA